MGKPNPTKQLGRHDDCARPQLGIPDMACQRVGNDTGGSLVQDGSIFSGTGYNSSQGFDSCPSNTLDVARLRSRQR